VATATATIMGTEAAVLGMLEMNGESSGYDLLKHARAGVGWVWAPAKSQTYAVLGRLVEAGHAQRREVAQSGKPDKQLYRITAAGRRALSSFLETVEPGARETFYLRVFLGGLMQSETLIAHVERFRLDNAEYLAELEAIDTDGRPGHNYYHGFMRDLGMARARTAIRWADDVLRELRANL
jgi:DNA-binding PadR family transcriptional regulator